MGENHMLFREKKGENNFFKNQNTTTWIGAIGLYVKYIRANNNVFCFDINGSKVI